MADLAYQVFVDLDATALEGGAIYLGVPNDDPEQNPIAVYWDEALTISAAQPLRTSGGVIVRDGTPSDVFANVQAYSIRVRNRAGKVVWYKPTTGGTSTSRLSFPIPSGPSGDIGPEGPTGPADNTYSSYAEMQASDPTRKSARLVGDTDNPPHPDGPYNNPSQTVGGWVLQQANGIAYSRTVNIALPLDRSIPRTLAYMSAVDPFTTASQTSKLQRAFSDAAGDGLKITAHPDAAYRKDAPLPIAVDFDGQGCSFVGAGSSNALQLSGSGRVWKNITNLGAAAARTSADATDGGIFITATDFVLENVEAGRVEAGKGHGAAAIFFAGAKRGVIRNSRALYSYADGHHCSDGCEDLTFYNPVSIGVGDDGFAAVSYNYQGTINKRIHTYGLRAIDVKARGLSVLGCLDSIHRNPTIIRSSAAAVYFVTEGSDSFNTLGSRGARVEGLYAENCVTGVDRPMLSQAIILVAGADGAVPLNDGTFAPLSVSDFFIGGRVVGAGTVASYALRTDSAANYRGGFDLKLEDIVGPNTADAVVQLGGQDNYGRIVIDGANGYPFVLMPSLTGDQAFETLQGFNTRKKSPGINEALHGSAANNWAMLYVDLLKFDGSVATPAGNMDLNKLYWRRFLRDGNVIGHP